MDVGAGRFEIMVKFTDLPLMLIIMDKLVLYANFIACGIRCISERKSYLI